MKNFCSQVIADIRQGILRGYFKYIAVFIISIVFAVQFYLKAFNYRDRGLISGAVNFKDCVICLFKGMREYIPASNSPFEVPVEFLLLNLVLAYMIGNYPMKDLHGFGRAILLRSNTRLSWWLSKCIWNILTVLFFYMMIYLGIGFATSLLGAESTASADVLNADLIKRFLQFDIASSGVDPRQLVAYAIILQIFTSIAISMLQMTLAFILNPIISYMFVVSMYIFSAYYMKWFMMGNFLMTFRIGLVNVKGMRLGTSLIVDVIVFATSAIVGYLYFRKYDVIQK